MAPRKRMYRVKKKKNILKNKLFQAFATLVLISGLFFWLTIMSPIFQTKTVLVSGNKRILAKEIEEFVKPRVQKKMLLLQTSSIFLSKTKEIENNILDNFPIVDAVKVKKRFPGAVSIEISEKEKVALWCTELCFEIDKKGIAFKESQEVKPLTIFSKQPKQKAQLSVKVIDEETLAKIIKIQKSIKPGADEFTLFESEARVNAKTIEGWNAFFYLENDLDWQLLELELILEKQLPSQKRQNLDYIDLRFDKAYYKEY